MEIDKTLQLEAPPERVWALLLDPQAMGQCVPGMESIEVISEDEYVALMKVKVSFVSARFKLKTRIVERREPAYLRAEGTGEDASVASSLKQTSEMWLDARDDGGTSLRLKVKVDVLGRIGSFGLAAMKTKADRLWDEFGVNAAARLAPAAPAVVAAAPGLEPATAPLPQPVATAGQVATVDKATAPPVPAVAVNGSVPRAAPDGARSLSWWARTFGRPAPAATIRVDYRRGDVHLVVDWPAADAAACQAWLRELVPPANDSAHRGQKAV